MPNINTNRNRQQSQSIHPNKSKILSRIRVVYFILLIIVSIFVIRLFELQIIKHNYYQQAANNDQEKQYIIPARRGMIEANSGGQIVPIVLNETLYTLFADPPEIQNAKTDATAIQKIIGGNLSNYISQLNTTGTEYVVLANKLSQTQANQIDNLNLLGVATQSANYRTYPDGSLAAQLIGFVNTNGVGQYGIEQALNSTLAGVNGQVKAVTDAQGIPLIGNKNNVIKAPVNGKNVVLTINLPIQEQLETILAAGLKRVRSNSGSVTIMDPNNGNIVAMANYPTYDPTNYQSVSNSNVYQNSAIDTPLEVGSIMKTLTVSAALDQGVVTPSETFQDPGSYTIDGSTIDDIAQDSGVDRGTVSVTNILVDSLNTGATWMLMQMGGGQINQSARDKWYNYMVNHFHLGSSTGIQSGYEASGYVPNPDNGYALDLTYANSAFGQAMTATPLQMIAADSAVLNGGTYYVPNLVQSIINPTTGAVTTTKPKIWKFGIVKPSVGLQLQQIMEAVINNNYYFYGVSKPQPGYIVGGKTGTAQLAQPGGGYYSNLFNGTFIGFVGTTKPQFTIMVEVNTPNIPENSVDTYAGAGAAAPIFGSVVNMLINGGFVN